MRLTAELITQSLQFLNPVNDRELDLRGNKIALIENLGVTKDAFDTIDLSDNEIRKLENFPQLNRLKHLLISNNRLEAIEANTGTKLPNLESLILSNNYFRELNQLETLRNFKNLQSVSLLGNLVTKKDNYRFYVIYLVPSLRYVDFIKVRQGEREQARKIFQAQNGDASKTFTVGSVEETVTTKVGLSSNDINLIKVRCIIVLYLSQIVFTFHYYYQNAIANAKTFEEMKYYEQCLLSNQMPKELLQE
jgi:U2 small nuclear ribonucleoprotein A'